MASKHHRPRFGGATTGKPPNAKDPKPRPPQGWRDKPFFPGRTLPAYTGPYPVGTMEIEVPVTPRRHFSTVGQEGSRLHQLDTVLMLVYYPRSTDEKDVDRSARQLWLGRPRLDMAEGYASFAGAGKILLPGFLPVIVTKLPAYCNAPVATDGVLPDGDSDPLFPLIMFSHGLGGTRTMYSSLCGEMASHGFIVCAVEHRDGSGPRTFVNYSGTVNGSASDTKKGDAFQGDASGNNPPSFDVIDFIWPAENPSDTSPNNDGGVERSLRDAQLAMRLIEMDEAYTVICEIADGHGQEVANRDLRPKGFQGTSSVGLEGVDWGRWKHRIHLDNVTACGHSFGAATVVEMLRKDDAFTYITQGIIYDTWAGGVAPLVQEKKTDRIHKPLLAISSEAFTYWRHNYEAVEGLMEETQSQPCPVPAWRLTVRGTVHVSPTDFPLLYPHITSLFLKATANPRRALDLHVNASLEFLSRILPPSIAHNARLPTEEHILDAEIHRLEDIPQAEFRRPDDDSVGVRLNIRHDWLYRISPKLFRGIRRLKHRDQGRPAQEGDEHWLHVKPSPEVMEEYRRRHNQGSSVP